MGDMKVISAHISHFYSLLERMKTTCHLSPWAPFSKPWTSSFTPMAASQWLSNVCVQPGLCLWASDLLSTFFLNISTDFSKLNIFKTELIIYLSLFPPDPHHSSWWNFPAAVVQPTIIRDFSPNNFPVKSPNLPLKYLLTVPPFPSTNPTTICVLLLWIFNTKVEKLKHSSSKSISQALSASSFINDPEKKNKCKFMVSADDTELCGKLGPGAKSRKDSSWLP